MKMASGTRGKSNEGGELGNGFAKDADSNPDLFLAASLQFLHRLLGKRTLQCVQLDGNGLPISRLQVEDIEEENNTTRELYAEQINQIEEYKRQLRSMENFLSTIQLDVEKPAAHTKADCKETMVDKADCNIDSSDSRCTSTYLYSYANDDEFPDDIPETPEALNSTLGETAPGEAGDFDGRLQKHPVDQENNRIQSSASYADIVRSVVSGLAKNYGKRHKSWRKKLPANSWLLQPGIMENPKEVRRQRVSDREVESELCSGKGSDGPKEIPLRIQLAMEPDASPRKPVTLLVRVPTTLFNQLNRRISKRGTKIFRSEPSAETHVGQGKRKNRLTSVFRNLLKGRTTPSSTSIYSGKDKPRSRATLAEEAVNNAETPGDNISRDTLIYTLQKNGSCDSIERQTEAEFFYPVDNEPIADSRGAERPSRSAFAVPDTKNINGNQKVALNLSQRVISYETKPWTGIPASSTRRQLVEHKVLRPEMMSNESEIVRGLTINYLDETIIPLRLSRGSPELGAKRGEISQRDDDTFLKLAAKMRKTQVYRDTDSKHFEIPVEIKTTETPLRLYRTQNDSERLLSDRVLRQEANGAQATSNKIETEQFLHMLVGTSPEGPYLPQAQVNRDLQELETTKNRPKDNFQHLKNNENSALKVLLRHIATGSSTCRARQSAAEKDTTVQTAPKRQLSKISVCSYSSESLSGSDHESPQAPEAEMKDSTVSLDECRDYNHVVFGNESKEPATERYSRGYKTTEEHYTPRCMEEKIVIDKSEERYAAGGKIQYSIRYPETTEIESSSPNSRRKLTTCDRTEIIIEEENCETALKARAQAQSPVANGKRTCLSVRETEKTIFCHPVLSEKISGQQKELLNAMIHWWGPRINYSTTPSSQTRLST